MHSHLAALICAAAVLASAPRLADAQPDDTARVHFETGQRLFDAGNYASAIEEFEKALSISGRPALWFNIAQAHRLDGDCAAALQAYERYAALDERATEVTNVTSRIDEMRACVDAQSPESEPGPEPAPTAPDGASELAPPAAQSPPVAPKPRDETSPRPAVIDAAPRSPRVAVDDGATSRWVGRALFAGGLAATGTSIYYLRRASADADELTRRYAHGGAWDDDAIATEQRAADARRRSAILAGVGGVAILTGFYFYVSGRRQGQYASWFAVSPRRGGAEVVGSWQF